MANFIPVALDTYFRGNSQEVAFCRQVHAGGNHLVAATAGGKQLAGDDDLRLRSRELGKVLAEYRALPAADRRVELEDPSQAVPPKRPVPSPPEDGLIVRGYCTYMKQDANGRFRRSTQYYYKENPDRWAAETQSDMLWLTSSEWRSLVPDDPREGQVHEVSPAIRRRFYSTIGIDYMEGSVNSLPVRGSSMRLTVLRVTPEIVEMRLDGEGEMGRPLDEESATKMRTRGCRLRVSGRVHFDRERQRITRFDVVGLGRAWGNKMEYVQREIRLDERPWCYGIACELVTGDSPYDLIPPYNMLHYGSAGPYFE